MPLSIWPSWQEWQGSNLRPPVLETGALPIELHSYRGSDVAADPRRFKHRQRPDCKAEAVNRAWSGRGGLLASKRISTAANHRLPCGKRPVQPAASAPDFTFNNKGNRERP
jgi:hypothetical protein